MIDPLLPVEEKLIGQVLREAKTHGWTTVSVVFNDHKVIDIQCQIHVSPTLVKKIYQTPLDSFHVNA